MVAVVVVAGAGMLTVVGLVWLETSGCCCGCRGGDADGGRGWQRVRLPAHLVNSGGHTRPRNSQPG